MRYLFLLVLTAAVSGCEAITDLLDDPEANVQVDPSIGQRILVFGAGQSNVQRPWRDPQTIACLHTIPHTCTVSEAVRVTITNTGPEPVEYRSSCPPPFQRVRSRGWELLVNMSCTLMSVAPVPIASGERLAVEVFLPHVGLYDWRVEDAELRVGLDLRGEDGLLLPTEMRTSDPFRLTVN